MMMMIMAMVVIMIVLVVLIMIVVVIFGSCHKQSDGLAPDKCTRCKLHQYRGNGSLDWDGRLGRRKVERA